MERVLFTSYDGLTDNLGQSQIIPYLSGLAKHGYRITVLSCEKQANMIKNESLVRGLLDKSNIEWRYVSYTRKPPVLSTLWDLFRMYLLGCQLLRNGDYSLVHSRTIISAVMGYELHRKFKTRFIFDMRGFWADERVESGMWKLSNPLYKAIYGFFKKKEKELCEDANHVVCLTTRAKEYVGATYKVAGEIAVIPCCADLDLFSKENVDELLVQDLRRKFKLAPQDFVLSYLGSIGTWYLLDEMLDFFKVLIDKRLTAKFLFITTEPRELIISHARAKEIRAEALIITSATRKEVPAHLMLSDWAIFFIQPVFAKSGSSPTKQGEIMGLGIPLVCNAGVGDVDAIVYDTQSGLVLKDFTKETYVAAIDKMLLEKSNPDLIRQGAFKYYSLDKGVESYLKLYRS